MTRLEWIRTELADGAELSHSCGTWLYERVRELEAVVQQTEWTEDPCGEQTDFCPRCGAYHYRKVDGVWVEATHEPTCELAAALRALDESEAG